MDSKTRLKKLADAATIKIETNIPIRRYYRSGNEMLKMARVYDDEGNMEAAYVLYLKYISLFLEKIKNHKDFAMVLPAEKKKTNQTLKLVLSISEEMKNKLKKRYEEEYEVWLIEEEERKRKLEEEHRKLIEEQRRRAAEERERADMIEKDRQLAIWTQAQIDKGLDPDAPEQPSSQPAGSPAHQGSYPDPPNFEEATAPPRYDDLGGSLSGGEGRGLDAAYPTAAMSGLSLDNFSSGQPPTYDRSAKPSAPSGGAGTYNSASYSSLPSASNSRDMPSIPDRSMKPVFGHDTGQRPVIVPTKLITRFLELAKPNSDRNVETLGMLGGKLSKNKFTVTHLLIPKQTGQSDRCDLQGHEELGDTYDSEDIILVGWIHTHPAYDVFLSSVDMHNQYEYQNMLNEFVAVVCSIKFNETGYLTLTDAGMEEIGKCTQENFHPHSKTPALFGDAAHVVQDDNLDIKVMDLR